MTTIYILAARLGALLVALASAAPLFAQSSSDRTGFHWDIAPGPHGTAGVIEDNSDVACTIHEARKLAYRFVLPPNGRAGAYFVPVRDPHSVRSGGCECGMGGGKRPS